MTEQYFDGNLIMGAAELPAVRTANGICWVLPGGRIECSALAALAQAEHMDKLIRGNLKKFKRTLFR